MTTFSNLVGASASVKQDGGQAGHGTASDEKCHSQETDGRRGTVDRRGEESGGRLRCQWDSRQGSETSLCGRWRRRRVDPQCRQSRQQLENILAEVV